MENNNNNNNNINDVIDAEFTEVYNGTETIQEEKIEYVEDLTKEQRDDLRRKTHTTDVEVDDSNFSKEEEDKINQLVSVLDYKDFDTIELFGKKEMIESNAVTDKLILEEKTKESNLGRNLGELEQFIVENKVVDYSKVKKDAWYKNPVGKALSLFNGKKNEVITLNTSIDTSLQKIENKLKQDNQELVNNNRILDSLFEENKGLHRNIKILIEASSRKIVELEEEIKGLEQKYLNNKDDERNLYELRDAQDFLERLKTKRHNFQKLEGYTTVRAPQLRAMQKNNYVLSTKLNDALTTTIPMWKGMLTTALQAQNTQDTLKIAQSLDDATNQLLLDSAKLVGDTSIEVEKAKQRGVLDDETIEQASQILLDSIKEVKVLEGNAERVRAESVARLERSRESFGQQLVTISTQSVESKIKSNNKYN